MQDSYWDPATSQFVCPGEVKRRTSQRRMNHQSNSDSDELRKTHAKYFKLVFSSCLILTILFTTICYGLTIYYEGKPPDLTEDLIKSAADMMKIMAGGVAGMASAVFMNTSR
jgi:hypothetical protein